MVTALQEAAEDEDRPNVLIVEPRGWFKTSILRGYVVWKQARKIFLKGNPFHRVVISSATLALTRGYLSGIGAVLRAGGLNGRLHDHFPDVFWRNRTYDTPGSDMEDGISTAARLEAPASAAIVEPSIFVGSIRRISTGYHADEAIIDDLNNLENVKTPYQRQQVHDYYALLYPIVNLVDRDNERGRFTMICTPWHDDDVRGRIVKGETDRQEADPSYRSPWILLQEGPLRSDGSARFERRLSLSHMAFLRTQMGVAQYSANILCDPLGKDGFVPENLLRWKSRETFPGLRFKRFALDPNQHKEAQAAGCYAALVQVGFDHFNQMYVVNAWGSRTWTTLDIITKLFDLHEAFPDHAILIEDAHMGHFQAAIQLEEARRSLASGRLVRLPVWYVPVDVKLSKYERWTRIQNRYLNGTVFMADEIEAETKIEMRTELVRGPVSRFKDFNDALALAEAGFVPLRTDAGAIVEPPKAPEKGEHRMTYREAYGEEMEEVWDG